MYLFLGCCLPLPPSPPPLTGVELGSERSSAWPLAALANGRGQRGVEEQGCPGAGVVTMVRRNSLRTLRHPFFLSYLIV